MPEQYTNGFQTTLNGSISSGATSLTLTSATGAPTNPNWRLRIDNELFIVTARTTVTCTVTPGAEGTTQAAHSSGAVVTEVLTAGALDAIRVDIHQAGVDASLPSTTGQAQGNRYKSTDGLYDYYFNGSIWVPRFPIYSGTKPIIANYTGTRGTSAAKTITDSAAGMVFQTNANSSQSVFYAYMAEPVSPYTFVLYGKQICRYDGSNASAPLFLGWRLASNGHLEYIGMYMTGSSPTRGTLACDRWNDDTTYNTSDASYITSFFSEIWLQIHRASTNYTFSFSMDGVNFQDLYTATSAATNWGGAPGQIIFGQEAGGNASQNQIGTAISLVQS